jgi:hypothetical protein
MDLIMKHSFRPTLILFAGIVLPSFAEAGVFAVQGKSSGVSFTSSPGGGTPLFEPGKVTGNCGGGNGSCAISGAATTTYSWVPAYTDEPAPTQVVVIESCNVSTEAKSFYGAGFSTPTGSSNNGMTTDWSTNLSPSTTIIYVYGPGFAVPIGVQKVSSSIGTRARIVGVGGTGNVVVTSGSISAAASAGNGNESATLAYSLTGIYPANISVAGSIVDANALKILPGQLAIGSLSIGAPGATVKSDSCTWEVTGDTFLHFVVTQDLTNGSVDRTTNWNEDHPNWRWTLPIQSNVTCNATITYNPGVNSAKDIGSISAAKVVLVATVSSEQVITCYKPGFFEVQSTPNGARPYLTSKPAAQSDATFIQYKALAPTIFSSQGIGEVSVIQILSDTAYIINGTPVQAVAGMDKALDGFCPYAKHSANGNFMTSAVDTPALGGYPSTTSMQITLRAKDYVMYTAPNGDYVPLRSGNWKHDSSASKLFGVWIMPSNTTDMTSQNEEELSHPLWNFRFVNVGG